MQVEVTNEHCSTATHLHTGGAVLSSVRCVRVGAESALSRSSVRCVRVGAESAHPDRRGGEAAKLLTRESAFITTSSRQGKEREFYSSMAGRTRRGTAYLRSDGSLGKAAGS